MCYETKIEGVKNDATAQLAAAGQMQAFAYDAGANECSLLGNWN